MISASVSDATVYGMARLEFVPERRADGTIVLRAVEVGLAERLRRLARRLLASA